MVGGAGSAGGLYCPEYPLCCFGLVWFGLPRGKIAEGRSGGESGRGLWELVQWDVTDH